MRRVLCHGQVAHDGAHAHGVHVEHPMLNFQDTGIADVHRYLTYNVMVSYLVCGLDNAWDSVALTAHDT